MPIFVPQNPDEKAPAAVHVYEALPTVLRQVYGGNDAVNTESYKQLRWGAFCRPDRTIRCTV